MKKKVGIALFLGFVALFASACSSSSSSNKKCGGETCKVGDHRHNETVLVIPRAEAASRE
ncbi:MAG: hypothetical protein K6E59_04520 [Bacilli bacterium]|nr:hypothetical protein [Bacilli bacterium]